MGIGEGGRRRGEIRGGCTPSWREAPVSAVGGVRQLRAAPVHGGTIFAAMLKGKVAGRVKSSSHPGSGTKPPPSDAPHVSRRNQLGLTIRRQDQMFRRSCGIASPLRGRSMSNRKRQEWLGPGNKRRHPGLRPNPPVYLGATTRAIDAYFKLLYSSCVQNLKGLVASAATKPLK